MTNTETARPAWQRWIVRHLFLYLALLAAAVVAVSVIFVREDLSAAFAALPVWLAPAVIALSSLNYAIRFLKWDRLLQDSDIHIDRASSAKIYFACLSMVVTPARMGELYKLVFLRRLHGIGPARSVPPLVLERATDGLALLALCAAHSVWGLPRVVGVLVAAAALIWMGALLAAPRTRGPLLGLLTRVAFLRRRRERIEELVEAHAVLLRPRSLAINLALSLLAWWAECLGLWLICRGLGAELSIGDATWIYAASTLLGNLTFLPGGLGGTELALKTLLERVHVSGMIALPATLLVRAATLWYAVFLGLVVTLFARRSLRWSEVREEAASKS
ncbi:hypothetical protein DRQ53_05140 [bacterium]|nr:MAG: hypothetical protein DRQ53_05140 [bacterium]